VIIDRHFEETSSYSSLKLQVRKTSVASHIGHTQSYVLTSYSVISWSLTEYSHPTPGLLSSGLSLFVTSDEIIIMLGVKMLIFINLAETHHGDSI
jgi:hypothetical protein